MHAICLAMEATPTLDHLVTSNLMHLRHAPRRFVIITPHRKFRLLNKIPADEGHNIFKAQEG